MRLITLHELLELYGLIMQQSGGMTGIRDLASIESALAQPRMTFDGNELYPTIIDKAAALGFTLIQNHPFIDGNKRIGHAAMETFLVLNGFEVDAPADKQEAWIFQTASGELSQEAFTAWLKAHTVNKSRKKG